MTYFLNLFGLFRLNKQRTEREVVNAFSKILNDRRPSKIWVDKGREFYNKYVRKLVELYSTENEEQSCIIENVTELLMKKMLKYFTANSTRKYIDMLDTLAQQFISTVHSLIKTTPVEASRKENENKVCTNFDGDTNIFYWR